MPSENRCALYARVSTGEQTVEPQLLQLRQYAEQRGWRIVREFVDAGISGSQDSRPELDALLKAAHQRKFDVLLTWKLDRLGRSLKHLVNTLADLEKLGVRFVSFTDNLDFTTPGGRLQAHILAAFAQFEKDLIVQRTRAGLLAARKRGVRLGRPRRWVDASQVAHLRQQGYGWKRIARALNCGVGTVLRVAKPT